MIINALKKRNRLFWKILVLFWVTLILTIIVNVVITQHILEIEFEKRLGEDKIQALAHDAVTLFEEGGPKSLLRWTRRQKSKKDIIVMVKYANGKPVIKFNRHRFEGHPPRPAPVIREITSPEGERYLVELHFTMKATDAIRKTQSFHGLRLIATLVILTLASWWLSRHLARPISSLSRASKDFANGNLSARVDSKTVERNDELGQLAKDFDHMAGAIETQVDQQKQLLRDISHEIRTPLTRQRIVLELARRNGGDEALLSQLENQNEKIDQLLEELLSLERMNNPMEQQQPFDVVGLVKEILQQNQIEANAKQQKLAFSTPSKEDNQPMLSKGNPKIWERAIENVLRNAIRYTPEQGEINLHLTQTDTSYLLSIEDSGPGVAEENLTRIFNPFFREDKARNLQSGGTGLGLSIALKAANLHRGNISAENIPKGGLRVSIAFPVN